MTPASRAKQHRMTLAVYASFIAALVLCGYLVSHAFEVSRARQIAACDRGNLVRKENNQRAVNLKLQRDVLESFLRDATAARMASPLPRDHVTARKYAGLTVKLQRVEYHTIALVNCAVTIDATK